MTGRVQAPEQPQAVAEGLAVLARLLGLPERDLILYRWLLGRQNVAMAELAGLAGRAGLAGDGGADLAPQLGRLLQAGLVSEISQDPPRYRARHPDLALAGRLWQQQSALDEARAAADELTALARDRARGGADVVERLTGAELIRSRLADLVEAARVSVAVIVSGRAAPATRDIGRDLGPDIGPDVTVRTLWPGGAGPAPAPSLARSDHADDGSPVPPSPATPAGSPAGGPTVSRTMAQPPPFGLVLVDGVTAMILPAPADGAAAVDAVVHHDEITVGVCADLFDRLWGSGRPLWPPPVSELPDSDRELLAMLNAGFTDAAVAHRLSISVRTVGRRLEELMRRLDTRTRFQTGVAAAQRGWL